MLTWTLGAWGKKHSSGSQNKVAIQHAVLQSSFCILSLQSQYYHSPAWCITRDQSQHNNLHSARARSKHASTKKELNLSTASANKLASPLGWLLPRLPNYIGHERPITLKVLARTVSAALHVLATSYTLNAVHRTQLTGWEEFNTSCKTLD